MTPVTFRVFGEAQPKGSTRSFVRKIRGQFRSVTTSDNPSLSKWESLVRFEAQRAMSRAGAAAPSFFDGPVEVRLRFGLIRPPSVSAKKRPLPTVKPDTDKLARGAVDPLIGVFFRDDAQVVCLSAEKFYVSDGPAYADITVSAYTSGVLIP